MDADPNENLRPDNNNTYQLGKRKNEILWTRRIGHRIRPNQLGGNPERNPGGVISYTTALIVTNQPECRQNLSRYRQFQTNQTTNLGIYRNHQVNYFNTEAAVITTIEEQEEPANPQQYPVIVPTQKIAEIHGKSSIHKEYENHDIHHPDH